MRRGLVRLNAGGADAGGLNAGRFSCVRRGLVRLSAGGLMQVGSMRVALSASLVQKLVKLADSERKDGVVLILLALLGTKVQILTRKALQVNYADFVRMCGDSASSLRGRVPPSSPSKLDAPQQVRVCVWRWRRSFALTYADVC